jgi:dGTPase
VAAAEHARDVVSRLFAAYDQDPSMLPEGWGAAVPADEPGRSRHLADFIAGMTDRYAIDQCVRIFGRPPDGLRNV